MRLFIGYQFPNWNEYISSERTNKYLANNIKQAEKRAVQLTAREKYTGAYPVTLTVRPHYKNRRQDLDNFRLKGLIDGLVAAGIIKNDNLTCIDKIIVEPVFDDVTGVEIEIEETERG